MVQLLGIIVLKIWLTNLSPALARSLPGVHDAVVTSGHDDDDKQGGTDGDGNPENPGASRI
jgi:hypothetical protein